MYRGEVVVPGTEKVQAGAEKCGRALQAFCSRASILPASRAYTTGNDESVSVRRGRGEPCRNVYEVSFQPKLDARAMTTLAATRQTYAQSFGISTYRRNGMNDQALK
eukprot:910950-Pleurochrysis_carterae.AAC.3